MKILVLCHGNINRSAACHAVLDFCGVPDVSSAGFLPGNKRAAKKMREAVARRGYSLDNHRSTQVTRELLDDADLVIYMDAGNKRRLEELGGHPNARCLGHWIGRDKIRDPGFMKRGPEFEDIVDQIVKASRALAREVLS